MGDTKRVQVNSGFGWATYERSEGLAVAHAFRDMRIDVEVRDVPDHEHENDDGKE